MRGISSLASLLLAGVLSSGASDARAQSDAVKDFASRPIKVIVPFTAGSGSDTSSRFFGEQLAAALKTTSVIENKPGGNGIVALQLVKQAPADGHTIVLTTHYLEEAEELCDRIAMLKAGRIVALDSTRNLLETFSGLVLKLRLDRNTLPDGLEATLLAAEGGRSTLRLRDHNALEQVLHRVRETGAAIKQLELEPPDLEDVFLRVMAKH